MKSIITLLSIFLSFSVSSADIDFEGYPSKKVEVTEDTTSTTILDAATQAEYKVVITKDGDKYYWTSRGNVPMIPTTSGYYITYLAVNGAGYVRTMVPEARKMFEQLPSADKAKQFLFVEHLTHQLGSINYYGQ